MLRNAGTVFIRAVSDAVHGFMHTLGCDHAFDLGERDHRQEPAERQVIKQRDRRTVDSITLS